MDELVRRWTATGKGGADGVTAWIVPGTSSIYATTGWGIGHAAISLSRFDSRTGETLASLRTRSREVTALQHAGDDLVIATDKRLWICDPTSLQARAQYDVPVAWPREMAAHATVVALATWTASSVLFVDRVTGATVRRRIPKQPSFVNVDGQWRVLSAAERGWRVLDLDAKRILKGGECEPTYSVHQDPRTGLAWARLAGPLEPTWRRIYVPGRRVEPLFRDGPAFELDPEATLLAVDSECLRVWSCKTTFEPETGRSSVLQCRDMLTGRVLAQYDALGEPRALDLASRTAVGSAGPGGPGAQHEFVCYELPDELFR